MKQVIKIYRYIKIHFVLDLRNIQLYHIIHIIIFLSNHNDVNVCSAAKSST